MDVNSSISLLSHIHTITADFIIEKLKERGYPDFTSSHGNILFQLSVNEKMTMGDLAEKLMDFQEQKRRREADTIMDVYPKSGKNLDEIMTFLKP